MDQLPDIVYEIMIDDDDGCYDTACKICGAKLVLKEVGCILYKNGTLHGWVCDTCADASEGIRDRMRALAAKLRAQADQIEHEADHSVFKFPPRAEMLKLKSDKIPFLGRNLRRIKH